MLAYLLLGLALGAGSSVVPGPCGLAVLDAGTRTGFRCALATAVGAGLGDLTYAALGVFGVGRLLASNHWLVSIVLATSGVVLVAYGVMCVRWRPTSRRRPTGTRGGLSVGFATLVCNPGALVTWSAIVGTELAGATGAQQLCAVTGIGAGSMAWFASMAHVATRAVHPLGARMHHIVHGVGCLILVYGVANLARAVL